VALNEDPGVQLQGSVMRIKTAQKIPVMIINNTNKVYKIKRGKLM